LQHEAAHFFTVVYLRNEYNLVQKYSLRISKISSVFSC